MAAIVLVDTGFLIALLDARDGHHRWAMDLAARQPPSWTTCEAVLSETFHILGPQGVESLVALLRRGAIAASFSFDQSTETVLDLMQKYANVPMTFADACLVRMTEIMPDPILLTTDTDFRVYRRHSRQTVPCVMPGQATRKRAHGR